MHAFVSCGDALLKIIETITDFTVIGTYQESQCFWVPE